MDSIISNFEFLSSNGRNKIKARGYNLTKENLKAIIVVIHGMTECKEIYSEFAKYLADKNYGVITYDHIGHGDSVNTEDERGFFANEEGYKYLTKDLEFIIIKAREFNLPVFLFGHSMGSLIARNYVSTSKKQKIDGLILCGTIGQQWAIDGAIQFAQYMIDEKGPRYRSRKLMELVTTISNWKFEPKLYKDEWSTRDIEKIKEFKKDKRMNFIFTAAGFRDVFTLVKITGQKESIESIPKELPIFIISGGEDILGEYSEGLKRLNQSYVKEGIKDVTLKIYDKARHALIHELNREEVFKDIYDWIEIVRLAKQDKI